MKVQLAAVVAAGAVAAVHGDLPVHCMGDEVSGEWILKVTLPSEVDLYSTSNVCGHLLPDDYTKPITDGDSFEKWYYDSLSADLKEKVKESSYLLCTPKASGEGTQLCPLGADEKPTKGACEQKRNGCVGTNFTLVYDEGMVLSANLFLPSMETKFVAFFRYEPVQKSSSIPGVEELESFVSHCDETISGFWTTRGDLVKHENKFYRGCFVAKKLSHISAHSSDMRGGSKTVVDQSFLVAPGDKQEPTLLQVGAQAGVRMNLGMKTEMRNRARVRAFLNQRVEVSRAFVNRINNANLGWTASVDSAQSFSGHTYKSALSRLGISRRSSQTAQMMELRSRFMAMMSESEDEIEFSTSAESNKAEQSQLLSEISKNELKLSVVYSEEERARDMKESTCALQTLGKRFSWLDEKQTGCKNVVPQASDQGQCGSCYAFSAATAATTRLRIARHPDASCQADDSRRNKDILSVQLSPQSILDCSYTNQGCAGGYPLLGIFHGYAEGLYDLKCDPYTAASKTCSKKDCKPYYIHDFQYAGGAYGYGTTMHDMMLDLALYGPLTAGIYASPELQVYKSGVFQPVFKMTDETIKSNHSFWEKTTHAVTIVGWDTVEVNGNEVPVWIIQNSWGAHWGENGTFMIRRGSNSIAVETMPLSARFTEEPPSIVGKGLLKNYESCLGN